MTRCETPQILHHQIKCCGALIALKTNTVTTQGTVKQKVCIHTELERGMVDFRSLRICWFERCCGVRWNYDGSLLLAVEFRICRKEDFPRALPESLFPLEGVKGKAAFEFQLQHSLLRSTFCASCPAGTSYSPQENSHNHSALHSSNSHSSNPSNNPSKTSDAAYDSADDWSEHISSSGKKYYYNCRTEVSQWEKPKEWLEREQRQKEASKMSVNSFPKDRDYRREVMQATAASGFASGMEDKHSSDASSMLPQNILSQTSRHNDRDYRLPRAETHSSSTPVQHPIKPVVHPTATPSTVPPSPFSLQSDHQPKKSFDANGASTLSKLPTSTSSIPAQKTERKVLTAAVTQASLQSILHKILTAGPSAFNITSLISQAAQLSTQAQPSNQSPMSLTSDASSPRSYVSPRISTPQTNTVPLKPLMTTPPVSSQQKVATPGVKQGPASQAAPQQPVIADKQAGHEPASPRSLQRSSSQRSPSPGPNHTSSTSASNSTPAPQNTSVRPTCSLTPTLAAHFNENLIKHVQGWPADHAEKQASRLREEAHNMGSVHMSEICTELKNLRSLVRVCEIQATLREQRILFLRQQIKELEKLKNQNSFMV
ncbi:WW domain-containing adapter protein with coiled-coil isoform X5 [Rissa tridactyla]|uniref:WW domain-containing adapter protein with coiled-coil isoform X5 n=1 Tax=Rissa tridactyla TaxID=75485 RepID=UPI0023BA98AD|nr:WW domain-containing adapter protein with coiled-coil isoform X5 [Rissa tridactyla]